MTPEAEVVKYTITNDALAGIFLFSLASFLCFLATTVGIFAEEDELAAGGAVIGILLALAALLLVTTTF